MADNNQKPKTKVNPLTAGIGVEGLKGLNTQNQTQEIKKESQVYTVTKNDGSQEEKSYVDLTPQERKAANTDGVVQGGKTDVERQYAVVNSMVGVRPTRNISTGSGLGMLASAAAMTAAGAKSGAKLGAVLGPVGSAFGAAAGAASSAATSLILSGAGASAEELKYQQALREFNDKVADNTVIAGSWEKDDDGNMIFMPDYSKVGEDINVAESGAKIAELFDLDEGKEPEVYFTDDNVLHVDINNTFSNTNEYQNIIDSISSDYAGLTKDTENVDQYLGDIKQRLSSAVNQYRFEVNRVAGYKNKLPNADTETIMDAARGEIGAMLADADKKDWPVKVYRDGEIVESNAKEVLDHVYNMKDKYERDDYLETLGDMLNDDSVSDNEKAYILSEYNLLFSASDADVKEGDASEERKKYKDMLDQDFLVTVLRSSGIVRGVDTLIDGVAGHITNGEVDDILIANQNYLEPDELAQNIGSITGAVFDVYVSQKIMQGLEQKLVRPALGAVAKNVGESLIASGSEKLGKIGEWVMKGVSITDITNRAGEVIGFRTALDISGVKNAALNNVIQAFGSSTSGLSCRLLAKGGGQVLVWSLGELAINFASDALFDATKLGTAVIAGEVKTGDEAFQYITDALGQDLVMDLVIQYGPMGMLDLQSTSDAIRLSHIEPYAQSVAKARTDYGDALDALNTAKANKKTTKKALSELETKVTAAKNDLTKAEVDYDEARAKWVGSGSQKFGAKLADLEARMTESEMFRKFQESVMDENVAGTALAKAAYAASGGDVDLFNKLLNTTSNNLRTITRITANEMASDKWAKGTGEAYNAFKQKYSELASRTGKLSKTDVDYIKAKNELIRYTEAANGDKALIAKAQAFYSKYIDSVDQVRAGQLDELMDTMREAVNKTNESAIKAGIQTEENIQTKRNATGFQKQGYIPMYLKRKNKTGRYVIGQERNLDHTWDRGDFWDIDNLENPALNTLTYINYTARNIAVNERNKAVIAATEIPGMRTYRTDADNEIIKTEDGHVYKHSDIIDHMKTKIDKRLNRIDKIKRETPTATEFSDGKNEILYGKTDGTHEELVSELETKAEELRKKAAGEDVETLERLRTEEKDLKKELRAKRKAQSKAELDELFNGTRRYARKSDLSDTLTDNAKEPKPKERFDLFDLLIPDDYLNNPYRSKASSIEHEYAYNVQWEMEKFLQSDYGRKVFSDELAAANGDVASVAKDVAENFWSKLIDELAVAEGDRDDIDTIDSAATAALNKIIDNEWGTALTDYYNKVNAESFNAKKQNAINWWTQTERLRKNLGVEAYTYGETAPLVFDDGTAYGVRSISAHGNSNGDYSVSRPDSIRIAIMSFESLPEMKSTIVHEAAHAAFSRAANRVPLLNDALRILGVDAKASAEIADSTAATELIAYMTQKKFLSENGLASTQRFLDDKTVQKHLDTIVKMLDRPQVSFKEKFISQVRNIITFAKAKLSGDSSLRNVTNLNDFYYGLVTGKFASDMRVDPLGHRVTKYGPGIGDMVIDWSKIGPDIEEMALDIIKTQEKIDTNKGNQAEIEGRIKASEQLSKESLRADVNKRINAMKEYYDNTYKKFGYTTNVRVSQAKIDGFIERNDFEGLATYLEGIKNRAALASPTDQTLSDVAFNKQVTGLEIELKRSMNKNFPGLDNEQKREVYSRILGEFRRRAAESGDAVAEQIANEAFVRNVGYPITYYEDGEEKTAYIDGPLAKPVYDMCVRSENVADRNFITKVFEGAGKLKRYATTTIDATRAIPNLLRDTLRGDIMSGGTDYTGARKIFAEILDAEGMTAEQKAKAMESIELAIKTAQGETLNAAIENRTERGLQDMVRETRQEGKNTVSRVIWDVTHGRIGHALETPMNVAESFTRRRMAQSAYIREFKNAKYTSTSFEERLGKAYDAGVNAGVENTTNFSRRGAAVGEMARYVPYFQQKFANIESAKIAFMKDPAGVAARAAVFQYAFVMVLADTLKKEETRRAYYNLSDYDRKNNIVFSLDGETLVTIPLDESLSSLITPWRRTLETLNGIDPGTFASIFTDTLLDLSPIDLDGFTEGDSLNVRRGMEKLASQMAPSLATEMLQTITGYNLYYGSDNAVTDESLAQRGQVAQSAGDYTIPSANSKILRKIADATGMPQWMLQQAVSNFGGNVGQYVLNTLDKLAGATEDEQGGKDWIKAVSKSMTGSDTTNMQTQFYNGISELKKEKTKVIDKLQKINDSISVATGTELAELKQEYQNIKDDYAMKVSNFVGQYLSTYEITGGLDQKLATQIYYLFYLYDDDTAYEKGSVGEYYQNLARQQAKNETASWAAPVLDKYYDQTQNVYKDSSGAWHYYSPYGEKAYYNTIYGQGMKHQVGLRNLIEGVTNNLKSARTAAYDARSAAMDKQDYDLYDKIGADFDAQVVEAIDPYIKEYGADTVLNNSAVLDYLEEWFFVPSSYMKTKKGRFVPSLANNASKQRAFVRPFIKSLYGVDTGYTEKNYESLLNPEVFENE